MDLIIVTLKINFLKQEIRKFINTNKKIVTCGLKDLFGNCCPLGVLIENLQLRKLCLNKSLYSFINQNYGLDFEFSSNFDAYIPVLIRRFEEKTISNDSEQWIIDLSGGNRLCENAKVAYEIAKWCIENNYLSEKNYDR